MILLATLAEAEQYTPPNSTYWLLFIQWIVPLIALIAFFIPLVVCIWRAAKYFGSATREETAANGNGQIGGRSPPLAAGVQGRQKP